MLNRGYKQTFTLLKIHSEMVKNKTFWDKFPISVISRKIPTTGEQNVV